MKGKKESQSKSMKQRKSLVQNKKIKENLRTCTPKMIICGVIVLIIVVLGFYLFFLKNDNKNLKNGNNLSNKSLEEIERYILNINSYEANITVDINSNKNKTKYVIKQQFKEPNIEKQIVEGPKNIKGIETIYDGKNLTVKNSKLNLSKIYENYNYLIQNYLWLNSFVEDYKNGMEDENSKIYEKDEEIIMQVKLKNINPNIANKKLIIDRKTGKIKKLIVQDKQQKDIVYILYNEIRVNTLNKEEILAFKLEDKYVNKY